MKGSHLRVIEFYPKPRYYIVLLTKPLTPGLWSMFSAKIATARRSLEFASCIACDAGTLGELDLDYLLARAEEWIDKYGEDKPEEEEEEEEKKEEVSNTPPEVKNLVDAANAVVAEVLDYGEVRLGDPKKLIPKLAEAVTAVVKKED